MIYNKFINCSTLDIFNQRLQSGDITEQHIVFIQKEKLIWTGGVFYASGEGSGGGGDEVLISNTAPEKGSEYELFIDTSADPMDIGIYDLMQSPSFESLPPSNQLEWTDSNGTHKFWIGQFIRVTDPQEENGYKFYQAVNVTDSQVTWQEGGKGGGSVEIGDVEPTPASSDLFVDTSVPEEEIDIYTKAEIDAKIGDIDTILGNIIGG